MDLKLLPENLGEFFFRLEELYDATTTLFKKTRLKKEIWKIIKLGIIKKIRKNRYLL